jgi:hypothetical protein
VIGEDDGSGALVADGARSFFATGVEDEPGVLISAGRCLFLVAGLVAELGGVIRGSGRVHDNVREAAAKNEILHKLLTFTAHVLANIA